MRKFCVMNFKGILSTIELLKAGFNYKRYWLLSLWVSSESFNNNVKEFVDLGLVPAYLNNRLIGNHVYPCNTNKL